MLSFASQRKADAQARRAKRQAERDEKGRCGRGGGRAGATDALRRAAGPAMMLPTKNQKFGAGAGPLVWQTFRGKVEIFNLTKDGVRASRLLRDGAGLGLQHSAGLFLRNPISAPACPGQVLPASSAWINLDETTQIA